MELYQLLAQSQLTAEKILSFLDAKSLGRLAACSVKCRDLANSDSIWHRQCVRKNYEKFSYLVQLRPHQAISVKTASLSPTFVDTNGVGAGRLEVLCFWRNVFNRAEHLMRNWRSGVYFIPPTMKTHNGFVSAFDSDGSMIVTGSKEDKLLKLWSIDDLECVTTIKYKPDSISCLKLYKDLLIAAGDEGLIKIFHKSEGNLVSSLSNTASGGINRLAMSDDGQLVASFNDKTIRVWCLEKFELRGVLRGHTDEIECLVAYKDILISSSWDNTMIVWDLKQSSKSLVLEGHSEVVNTLKMVENMIVSGSSDSTLRIWRLGIERRQPSGHIDRMSLSETQTLVGHQSDVYCLEVYGAYIASGGADSLVIVWSRHDGRLLHKLSGHLGIVRFIHMDEHKLVTGGDSKKIIVWNYRVGSLNNVLHRNPSKIQNMFVDDTKIIVASPEADSNLTLILYW